MGYEPTDHEWTAIKPMLPNKPRGVARVKRPACPQLASFGYCGPARLGATCPRAPVTARVVYRRGVGP